MAYHATITADQVRDNLQKRITQETAEYIALKSVKLNTKHKTLTNKAIEGATVFNYLDIDKAIRIPYTIKHPDGHIQYASREITAYTYNNPDGSEIGTEGCIRISRTYTPAELAEVLRDVIESKAEFLGNLQSEHKRAESIAKKHNALVEKLKEFNDSISNASEAQI